MATTKPTSTTDNAVAYSPPDPLTPTGINAPTIPQPGVQFEDMTQPPDPNAPTVPQPGVQTIAGQTPEEYANAMNTQPQTDTQPTPSNQPAKTPEAPTKPDSQPSNTPTNPPTGTGNT